MTMRHLLAVLLGVLFCTSSVHAQQCFPEIQCRVTASVKQTVASGDTLQADRACGTLLSISSAGNISTSSTLPFPAPSSNNDGCHAAVCNTGANIITVKHVASFFLTATGSDVDLDPNTCIGVLSTGTGGVWYETWTTGGTANPDS